MQAKTKSRRKGESIMALVGYAIAMVVLVVAVAVGAQVLGQIQDTQTTNTTEYNVTAEGLEAMSDFSDWFAIIVVVVIAAFIIGFLLSRFQIRETEVV